MVTNQEYYENFGKTGTWGLEMEYLLKGQWGYLNTNYSFYRAKKDKLEAYTVATNAHVMLGFPAHKCTLNANVLLNQQLSINPSVVYYSKRYGYESLDEAGNPLLTAFAPVCLVNLFISYKNIVPHFDLGLGVYDVLGKNYHFIQPYNGAHAPYPGPSREILMRLTYNIE